MHDVLHDYDNIYENIEDNVVWTKENIELTSVGIDVGSSGTQVIFSKLKLSRQGEDLCSRYIIVSRETIYQSPVYFTPFLSETKIDHRVLSKMILEAYKDANMTSRVVDTGAVILTGEAIRRENAQSIARTLAEQGGEFVCATAGHHMEATMAAYGSGAALRSNKTGKRILNVDIGGGTTKLAVVEKGRVLETSALHVGGRLLVVDEHGEITRLDPGGSNIAKHLGYSWTLGDRISHKEMKEMAEWMADAILNSINDRPLSADVSELFLTCDRAPLQSRYVPLGTTRVSGTDSRPCR